MYVLFVVSVTLKKKAYIIIIIKIVYIEIKTTTKDSENYKMIQIDYKQIQTTTKRSKWIYDRSSRFS